MHQALSTAVILKFLTGLTLAIFVACWAGKQPSDPGEWLSTVSLVMSLTTFLIGVLGATPLWRIAWRLIPSLNDIVFLDLNGTWRVSIRSNINSMTSHSQTQSERSLAEKITSIATIQMNLFRTSIIFRTESGYSRSKTLCVQLKKDNESGQQYVCYTYENDTPEAIDGDEQRHYGSARVEIVKEEKKYKIDGVYWTNRNWRNGMNTAGTVRFEKLK